MATETCPECGAVTPVGHLTHAYVPSSPGCWEAFGEVQAEELMRFQYPAAHRLVVDAYMAQHVGASEDRRQVQSVFVHLMALCLTLERGLSSERVVEAMRRALPEKGRRSFPKLFRRPVAGELNVLSLRGAETLEVYSARAEAWARSVWATWSEHHALIRQALPLPLLPRRRGSG
ncbi:MAG: DUF5946 family protein [Myxococcaceae bacterium]